MLLRRVLPQIIILQVHRRPKKRPTRDMAPRATQARRNPRINPADHPVAVGIKAGRVAKPAMAAKAKASVVVAASGKGATLGNAINVNAAATAVALGNPTVPAVMAAVVLVVTEVVGLARCIRRSRFRRRRPKFLAICRIPRVSLIWPISIRLPRKFPPAVASRWYSMISTR